MAAAGKPLSTTDSQLVLSADQKRYCLEALNVLKEKKFNAPQLIHHEFQTFAFTRPRLEFLQLRHYHSSPTRRRPIRVGGDTAVASYSAISYLKMKLVLAYLPHH
ncbi:hypothetical protein LIER_39011 [Lithospermum erythrorhizon]|uniref:Uncharacterized protein n=1 Tax=Lithospermum erythrorhizon TaxID=34254 RepID=A0AAV3QDM8_LITER